MALNEWKLLTSAGFFTFPHHDAGGLATYVSIKTGMKIWGIFRPKVDTQVTVDAQVETQQRLLATDAILNLNEIEKHADLFVLFLTPGSVL